MDERVKGRLVGGVRRLRRRVRSLRKRTSMHEFFDRLAPVYDDWWHDRGRFKPGERHGWATEVEQVLGVLHGLEPGRTLDVGCGTGFLTAQLPGDVTGLDQSEQMLEVARKQAPDRRFVRGDATNLPFPDGSFDRVFASVLCTHLEPGLRERFFAEARRVARETVILESAVSVLANEPDGPPAAPEGEVVRLQTRQAPDGARYAVYKRWVTAERLRDDLGGGDILHDGQHFVIVRSPCASGPAAQ